MRYTRILLILLLLNLTPLCMNKGHCELDSQRLANAIFKAEGGYEASYLYGIRSISYKDEAEARRICLNTINNQKKRHRAHKCGLSFLTCLRNRYAPLQVKNDPKGLNSNWLRNVKYFYNKEV